MNLSPSVTQKTMTSIQLAEMLRYEKKRIHEKIKDMFSDKIAGRIIVPTLRDNGQVDFYTMPELESKMFVAKWDINYLEEITQFWIDNKPNSSSVLPDFSNPVLMAREWADKQEQLQFAIHTKAEIGNRREATAMNTASQAVKKANRLEVELDRSKEYSSIKRMEIITGEKFNWRLLKATSQALDKHIVKVPDQNYVEINAYHYLVWLEAYNLDIV